MRISLESITSAMTRKLSCWHPSLSQTGVKKLSATDSLGDVSSTQDTEKMIVTPGFWTGGSGPETDAGQGARVGWERGVARSLTSSDSLLRAQVMEATLAPAESGLRASVAPSPSSSSRSSATPTARTDAARRGTRRRTMTDLPNELVIVIARSLRIQDVLSLAEVCLGARGFGNYS